MLVELGLMGLMACRDYAEDSTGWITSLFYSIFDFSFPPASPFYFIILFVLYRVR